MRLSITRNLVLAVATISLAAILPFAQRATTQSSGANRKPTRVEFVPGTLLVRFRKNAAVATKADRVEMVVAEGGTQISLQIERLDGAEIVEGLRVARVAPQDTMRAIEALRSRADVLYAEPNYIRRKVALPNDPRFAEMWGLKNTGQTGGTVGADIKAEQAWDITTGSRSVVVAVIDEGIEINHQDLQQNIWRNPGEISGNGIDDDSNGFVDDINGYDFFHSDGSVYDGPGTNPDGSGLDAHGTHVAGTIGAVGNNGIGVVGVNWQVSMMSLKFLGPESGSSVDAIRAYAYAKMMRDLWVSSGGTQGANVRVTNNSYGGDDFSQAEVDAIRGLGDSGILFVAAAGNEAHDNDLVPSYPATYDLSSIISVAATDRNDGLVSFSNRGSRTVHIGAPGASILSTVPGNAYALFSGTSMASPLAAGVAALVLAGHPDFNINRLRAAVLFGSVPIDSLAQTTITGARLTAAGSLQNSGENDTTPPSSIADLHINSQDGRNLTLGWTAPGDDDNSGRASLYELSFVDQSTGAKFRLATQRPALPGVLEFADVSIPYRHTSGTITLLVSDNAGNTSTAGVGVSVSAEAAEPYVVTEGSATPLTTGGNALQANYDDSFISYPLPFNFPFFESYHFSILLSTNGALYFDTSITGSYDVASSASRVSSFPMIAGLWDDLDLRTASRADAGIYVVQPDANRIIFRWQGVPCNENMATGQCAGGDPVNFEIELQRDGTIVTRYGSGNGQLRPVVGIGGGEPDSYTIASHTSEVVPKDLTNAPMLTFALRSLPKQADLRITTQSYPNPVMIGDNITYTATITNAGPDSSAGIKFSDTLSISELFVSCTTTQGKCSGPNPGSSGKVSATLGRLAPGANATVTIVTTTPIDQSSYTNFATVSATTYDPIQFQNSSYTFTEVFRPNPNPLTGVTGMAAGGNHSLALLPDGSVLAWGYNASGQLGDGSSTNRNTPSWVKGLASVKSISAGNSHSMAIKQNGNLWTWGGNYTGQLGNGTTSNQFIPARVDGISGVSAAAGGLGHTIALRNDGTVWTWGDNSLGQIGDGVSGNRLTPVQVPGLSGVTGIAAGFNHCVAQRADGTVWTWGDNSQGQLGDGSTTNKSTPTQVSGLTGITAIAADGYFTLALRNDGTVWSWGSNIRGQLGDGTTISRSTPAMVSGLTGIVGITSGVIHSLALRNDGTIWGWGSNSSGQLGVGINYSPLNYQTTPVQTIILTHAISVEAGGNTGLGLTPDGTLYAWGESNFRSYPYQVNAAQPRQTVPLPSFNPDGGTFASAQSIVVSLPSSGAGISAIALGSTHSVALMSNGTINAWGQNDSSQLGAPSSGSGGISFSPIPMAVNGLTEVAAISSGYDHSVALRSDGTAWAWGSNSSGALGDGTNTNRSSPVQVRGLTNITSVSAGVSFTLALRGDGTVWAWGDNSYGRLGDGTENSRSSPVQVIGLTGVRAIGAAYQHSLAVKNDGTVWAWGHASFGELGNGSAGVLFRATPVQAIGLTNVVAVAGGSWYSVALRNDGTIWTWGVNTYGQLGDGTNELRSTPAVVPNFAGATAISSGNQTTMALRNDGTVWTWGQNDRGQLGIPGPTPWSYIPVQVNGLTGMTSIDMSGMHAAAVAPNGALWIWGYNLYGQLGDGSTSDNRVATRMAFFSDAPVIHYTTNGSDPTDDDPVVVSGASVMVDRNMVLKARAFRDGFAPSGVKSGNYMISVPNPIDDARNFIRQHYLDFLSREPDQGGWDYWTSEITACGNDAACVHRRRIDVSAAYFVELEFQRTGYVVYRLYRAAHGTWPNTTTRANLSYTQFNSDRAQLVDGAGLAQSTINLANAFVQRPEFLQVYNGLSNALFVNQLFDTAQLTPYTTERQQQIDAMNNSGKTRAQVLLDVVEIGEFKTREYNPAFVLMQYFGYLRRDPDQGGYDFWLNVLDNRVPNNFRAMVCAFLTSAEYQQRFGATITRTNNDCSQ